ncbi:enoyl-CoA hydratase-related protein [Pseudomonas citrulli]|jgi:2-ketocyclohexanecarboxyl-CoA hydrolase|uniref:1,4-dihydroxy-2-naphthoyl-CoA synthase n=1 Tax=Pseudomonas lurida TaxID=244566 RepID=A0ABY9FP55_9PSED|nr:MULTISPECIES: enoyl-CoA hydratase-related protein [Pseudomonas]QDH66528.1 1,4-dihydroxy-2-naphthoyl-CoA synthase [Pseudomonas azotoformans]WLG54865.1 enoyl-CoA hydratase-related protein [Pseudomonas extremorientalis]WLH05101.1 enoyl-CoA hydratase-related protein [Pseudomonas lurida]
MEFKDILYTEDNGVATITINRPQVYNAFTANTCEELIQAFSKAGYSKDIGVVVLTGVGDKAFCTGSDQSGGRHAGRGVVGLPIEELQSIIRDIPKPVIARVNGYAIGGGNVLVTLCDLAIASETAQLGQVGPKVGSVDPGFGTALLARLAGDKRAREIWYLCRRYSAQQALDWGLVNAVVPADQLDAEVKKWCDEILLMSPTAIALAKRSFNMDNENIRGIGAFAMQALAMYYDTEESKEGGNAFREKRKPEFRKYAK